MFICCWFQEATVQLLLKTSAAPSFTVLVQSSSKPSVVVLIRPPGLLKVLKSFLLVSDADPVKPAESEGDKRPGAKDRRRQRKERRSTGIVQPREARNTEQEDLNVLLHGSVQVHRAGSGSSASRCSRRRDESVRKTQVRADVSCTAITSSRTPVEGFCGSCRLAGLFNLMMMMKMK